MAQRRKKASSKARSQSSRQRDETPRQLLERERALRKQALAREKEALDRQAATAEILKVISGSPADVAPVMDAIAERARLLCGASLGYTTRADGKLLHLVGYRGVSAQAEAVMREMFPRSLDRGSVNGRAILAGEPVQIPDVRLDPEYQLREQAKAAEFRSMLAVPMMRGGEPIGAVGVARKDPGAFSDRLVSLLKTFADQAVIAIENARLFNETKESLEQQTAMGEVLRIVSRTVTDAQPAFDAILGVVRRLFPTFDATVWLVRGEDLVAVARDGPTVGRTPGQRVPVTRDYIHGRALLDRRAYSIDDVPASKVLTEVSRADLLSRDRRAILIVPLVRQDEAIGAISVSRAQPYPFAARQVALLQTFADQAVIAIENARLFNETKEALDQQTATAEILKVIASSPSDVQPVLEAIVRSASQLFSPCNATIFMRDGNLLQHRAMDGTTVDERLRDEVNRIYPVPFDPASSTSARAMVERRANTCTDTEAPGVSDHIRRAGRAGRFRSNTVVPLVRDDEGIGTIVLTYPEPGYTLSEKQLALLRTFADQAVIAIENVRLFRELQTRNRDLTEALDQQTATGEILKVISGTHTDVQPVFDTIVKNAVRLCDGATGVLFRYDGKLLHVGAMFNHPAPIEAAFRAGYPMSADASTPSGRAIVERRAIVDADILESDYLEAVKERARTIGYRSNLTVPLMREGTVVGAIAVTRREPGLFPESYLTLLKTFADQAVIAIENVRLFNETKEALEQQKASADVLSVISASIADTTPVFAKILDSCERLFEGHLVGITVVRPDGMIDRAAYRGPHEAEIRSMFPMALSRDSASGNAILDAKVVHYPDIEEPGVPVGTVERFRMAGTRAIICAPMLFEGQGVGAIWVGRKFAAAFTDKQIALLRTFADQAAIAIQNAKLFREIQEKSAQLEVASEHKSHFLASMSHELRTPLNAILGFNEMLLDHVYGELSEDVKAPLENMQASGKHLLRLINNVLDLAKIEAGRMELALGDYSVHDTVESVRSTLRPLAAEKGLEFLANVPADIPLAYGDAGRIMQCLMNLAGNSLKFTKEGRVEISVQQQNGQLRYCVADTGIGISPDKIGSLFTEFKQTDATIASEYGGTGLGLSITKKFIEMHGGRIWVESEPGTGSTFTFEVPLRAGERKAA